MKNEASDKKVDMKWHSGFILGSTIIFWGYIRILESRMEATIYNGVM